MKFLKNNTSSNNRRSSHINSILDEFTSVNNYPKIFSSWSRSRCNEEIKASWRFKIANKNKVDKLYVSKNKYHLLSALFLIAFLCSILISFANIQKICGIESGCDIVQNSKYAYFLGIKNSHFGVLIFLSITKPFCL